MSCIKFVLAALFFLCIYGKKCDNEGINNHLGTKTPYRIIANTNHSIPQYEGCQPTKIWMMVRHGTRNPNTKLINLFSTRLPEIRDLILRNNPRPNEHILQSDLDAFRKWAPDIGPEDQKKLTSEGKSEMLELAERMQARFPTLLPPIYSNTSYQFKYTKTQRTLLSARYFTVGLFGKQTAKDVWYPEALQKDPILRFYKLCERWRTQVKKNPRAVNERSDFDSSFYMNKVVDRVNKILNLGSSLTYVDVHAIYTTCAFETAWNKRKKSPWCIAFDEETVKVLEYSEDLKYYWIDGYGYKLTYKQACPAFNDMIRKLTSNDKYPLATIYFTHSGTLLKMLAHLGVYHDEQPLRSDDFGHSPERLWKVSEIDAFGTNLAFVMYKCQKTPKLLVLHQEKTLRLPSCPNTDLCDLNSVKNYYRDSINNCDFQEMCSLEE